MKSHLTAEGPKPCNATSKPCPYGDSGSHFDSVEEAQEAYEKRQSDLQSSSKKGNGLSKPKLNSKEKELVKNHNELLKDLVSIRSQMGDVAFEGANPERAERRIKEAIDFSETRGNTFLAQKLKSARVLPSGAFKTKEGLRVNTDSEIKKHLVLKNIESEREKVIKAATKELQNEELSDSKYSLKTKNGSYSMTVGTGINREAFEELNEKTKKECMSPVDSYNVDHAREILPKEKFDQITRDSQVIDFISGKPSHEKIEADSQIQGKNGDEKARDTLEKIDAFYGEVRSSHGNISKLKKSNSEGKEAIKRVAAKTKGNVFAPARSQKNGALVSGRLSINAKAAKEVLTEDELKSISTKRMEPDADKAKIVLNDESFGRIFNARKLSVRFTESKE